MSSVRSALSAIRRPNISRRGAMITMALSIIFTIAITMRTFAAKYGFYLNEFDPYYDYYAAQHVVTLAQEHGLFYALFNNPANCGPSVLTACHDQQGYFYWHDIQTWFPYGRDVAATSQDGLQLAGAGLYLLVHNVFGVQITLYDFLVLLPVFLGGITAIMFYFLVRRIAGEAAGLFAALMFAVSPPLIERGNLGWFKSEPLAIFLFVGASYLVLSLFDTDRALRSKILRATLAGLMAGYGETAWGGSDYFTVAFGLLFLLMPFLNLNLDTIWPAAISFTAALVFGAAVFPRPGVAFVTNPAGLAILGGTVFLLVAHWSKSWIKPTEYRKTLVKFLIGFGFGGLAILSFGLVGGISLRYLAAIDPAARASSALVQSVAEQAVPTGNDYFTSYLILLAFGMAGAIVAFRRKNVPTTYALIIGLSGLYISASYSRLLVYSSIALGLLGGIGFAELVFSIVKPSATPLVKKKPVATSRNEMKVVYSVALILLIAVPAGTYWIPNPIQCTNANTYFCDQSPADAGVSLVNGATTFSRASFPDWTDTLQWINQNTPTNSVIIGWWDYGYWITVMGNRTTVDDNATLNATRIAEVGQMYMSNLTTSLKLIQDMAGNRPAYVILFLTGSVFEDSTTGTDYYILQVPAGQGFTAGGGDESKKQWFIRIGGLNESELLECPAITASCQNVDDFNLTPYALQNTLFGKLLPFQFADFLVPESDSISLSSTYEFGVNGSVPVEAFSYPYSPSFPANNTAFVQMSGNETGLFRLAYASPSLASPETCPGNSDYACFNTILVYSVTFGTD